MDKSNLGTKTNYRYTNVRMTIVFVIVVITLCCSNLIDAAAVVHSENFGDILQRRVLQEPGNIRIERDNQNIGKRNCHNTPCGWAVYNPETRVVEYYMKNTCECLDSSYKCVRAGDDLSASAYMYLCKQNTTPDDIHAPEDAL